MTHLRFIEMNEDPDPFNKIPSLNPMYLQVYVPMLFSAIDVIVKYVF